MFNPPHLGEFLRAYTDATLLSVTQIAAKLNMSRKMLSVIFWLNSIATLFITREKKQITKVLLLVNHPDCRSKII